MALARLASPAAARPLPRARSRARGRDWRAPAAAGALAVMSLAALGMVLTAASGVDRRVVNASRAGYPGWMKGVFGGLVGSPSNVRFYVLLLVMTAAYLVVVAWSGSVPARATLGVIAGLHVLFVLAPPLLSRDVFNYVMYARVGALHGLNPYLHGTIAAPFDPSFPYVCCHHSPNPYGPLFTLASYVLAPLGLPAAFWALKAAVGLAGLGCVALVWKGARLLGRDPLPAVALVGLNPVWLAFTIGGGHNDLIMELFAVGGVVAWLAGRQAAGAATVVVGLATKVSAAIVLPFMVLASRSRWRVVAAAALAGIALLALWLGVFGTASLRGWGGAISAQQQGFFQRSIPQQLGVLLHLGPRPQELRTPLTVLLVAWVAWMLWRTWRGVDWIACAGWATLGVLVTTTWLLPWYGSWLLPLAALGDDRRLRLAALAATLYLIWARTPLILG